MFSKLIKEVCWVIIESDEKIKSLWHFSFSDQYYYVKLPRRQVHHPARRVFFVTLLAGYKYTGDENKEDY